MIGPGARAHAAGADDRLRRQPHVDARGVRRAGDRHRHIRGGARTRDADASAVAAEDDARRVRRAICRSGSRRRTWCSRAIGQIGVAGAQGHVVEYTGAAVRALSMEGRMTVCNMSIEAGARAGMIAPDDATFAYLEGRPARHRRRLGACARRVALAAHRRRRGVRPRGRRRPGRPQAAGDMGHEPGDGRAGRRRRARPGRL